MNDSDRRQWIDNYEPLYLWHRYSREPMAEFIRNNKESIDYMIENKSKFIDGPKEATK